MTVYSVYYVIQRPSYLYSHYSISVSFSVLFCVMTTQNSTGTKQNYLTLLADFLVLKHMIYGLTNEPNHLRWIPLQ